MDKWTGNVIDILTVTFPDKTQAVHVRAWANGQPCGQVIGLALNHSFAEALGSMITTRGLVPAINVYRDVCLQEGAWWWDYRAFDANAVIFVADNDQDFSSAEAALVACDAAFAAKARLPAHPAIPSILTLGKAPAEVADADAHE